MVRYSEHIPCTPETKCFIRDSGSECFEDIHHEAYYRKNYRTRLEKQFREHVLNKILICRAMHTDEHAQQLVPKKPTIEEMKKLIGGENNVLLGNQMEEL